MKTFSKPSFTHFFKRMAPPGGGGLPGFTSCGTNYLHTPLLKKYPKSKSLDSSGMFFEFSAPQNGGVLMKTFSKLSFTHFSQRMPPPRGGGLPDFTSCGTNYLHTPLLKKYPNGQSLDYVGMFFWIQRPQKRGVPHENIFKTLIYPFFSPYN